MSPENKYNILIAASLVAGVGLCIGGIFYPPLLIPGGLLITGGLGALAALIAKKHSTSPRATPESQTDTIGTRERAPSVTITIDNRSVTFTPHFDGNGYIRRGPTPEAQGEVNEPSGVRLTLV